VPAFPGKPIDSRFFIPILAATLVAGVAFGQFWTPQASNTTSSLRGVSVVSSRVVWASGTGGTYLITTDGGANWRAGKVPGAEKRDFRSVYAVDGRTALVASVGEGAQSAIYKTSDAGQHWRLAWANPHAKGFFDALAFWDGRRGLVLSDPVEGSFRLFATFDQGGKWRALNGPEALPQEGAFAASGTCLVARGKRELWFAGGGVLPAGARIFHSVDGGSHWTAITTPVRSDGPAAGIFSLAFAGDGHAIAVGGDYSKPADATRNIAISTDGGRTWMAPRGTPPAGYRSAVAYLKDRCAWVAAGTSGSDISFDGGENWATFDTGSYNAVAFVDSQAGWAVGPKGRIARFHWK
jgi:photosystem II stability/assembly factor-like uncharacterized protein